MRTIVASVLVALAVSVPPAFAQSDSTEAPRRPEISIAAGIIRHQTSEALQPVGATASAALSSRAQGLLGVRATLNYIFIPPHVSPGVVVDAANLAFATMEGVIRPGHGGARRLAFIAGAGVYREFTGLYVPDRTTVGGEGGVQFDLTPHIALDASIHVLRTRLAGSGWFAPVVCRFAL